MNPINRNAIFTNEGLEGNDFFSNPSKLEIVSLRELDISFRDKELAKCSYLSRLVFQSIVSFTNDTSSLLAVKVNNVNILISTLNMPLSDLLASFPALNLWFLSNRTNNNVNVYKKINLSVIAGDNEQASKSDDGSSDIEDDSFQFEQAQFQTFNENEIFEYSGDNVSNAMARNEAFDSYKSKYRNTISTSKKILFCFDSEKSFEDDQDTVERFIFKLFLNSHHHSKNENLLTVRTTTIGFDREASEYSLFFNLNGQSKIITSNVVNILLENFLHVKLVQNISSQPFLLVKPTSFLLKSVRENTDIFNNPKDENFVFRGGPIPVIISQPIFADTILLPITLPEFGNATNLTLGINVKKIIGFWNISFRTLGQHFTAYDFKLNHYDNGKKLIKLKIQIPKDYTKKKFFLHVSNQRDKVYSAEVPFLHVEFFNLKRISGCIDLDNSTDPYDLMRLNQLITQKTEEPDNTKSEDNIVFFRLASNLVLVIEDWKDFALTHGVTTSFRKILNLANTVRVNQIFLNTQLANFPIKYNNLCIIIRRRSSSANNPIDDEEVTNSGPLYYVSNNNFLIIYMDRLSRYDDYFLKNLTKLMIIYRFDNNTINERAEAANRLHSFNYRNKLLSSYSNHNSLILHLETK